MQIKIGPIIYEVVEEKGLTTPDKNSKLDGHIRYGPCEIAVDVDLSEQSKRVTIWHEVVHAILETAGIHKHDEGMVDALAYGIMGVLQDNEWLREPPDQTKKE